ncbi:hypothetical protein CDL12_10296 [Handroanthus impetiginosus]|uniref:Uncharacterized protein n=1 Tax=Handroanthus impetiginosus TaxID=429701 RepID=A0A2G9HIA9_9LAMI|nr:hypothetical protein CDL12_10296 [Handroanthus impetiginosus]
MAMSRIFSQPLPRSFLRRPTAIISHHRYRSNKTHHGQLIEVEIDPSSSQVDSPEATAEVITIGIKKLEDAIHNIAVRRAAPDWLPFLPGYSYWVPPRASAIRAHHPDSMIELIGKLTSSGAARNGGLPLDSLLEEEHATPKGWPSSAFYVEGTSPTYPIPVVEEEVKVQGNDDEVNNTSNSKDEEG